MRYDRKLCSCYDCLMITCSRNRCHRPQWYNKPIKWIPFHEQGCEMYISRDKWKTIGDVDWNSDIV